ncbi:hypothetical protein EDC01DRAFT_651340 [Geopyxis carbonaria]|nr:hypothetical protein EDC01DRAFT_651340 [Geopyxis carbonaria]
MDHMEDDWKDEVTEDKEPQTLFLEDTVEVQANGQVLTGLVFRTWHDIDEDDSWDDIDNAVAGAKATPSNFLEFKKTGSLSRGFVLFSPSLPEYPPMLVHESECRLLDRSLAFGDVVKTSLTSPQSGTVISVQTTVSLNHTFRVAPQSTDKLPRVTTVESVLESDLKFANEWNEGDFILYKNCWMGVVEEVYEDIGVRLENESVVIVDDPLELEIYISSEDGAGAETTFDTTGASTTNPTSTTQKKTSKADKTIEPPTPLSVGMKVKTAKANLRRGRWLFGAYDPTVSPSGVVITTETVRLGVHWLCQNMMVPGKFVPMSQPESWLNLEEESGNIRPFKKSSSGFVDINGDPFSDPDFCAGGGELQVGDRVRFRSREVAERNLGGTHMEIPRTDTMGFDVNVYVVSQTKTVVRVLWQDTKETVHDACTILPYLNVDDHEVWPGEIVVIKDTEGTATAKNIGDIIREHGTSNGPHTTTGMDIWDALRSSSQMEAATEAPVEFLRPKKVGVVQSVDPAGRVANVRWYISPNVELAAGIMIPGSRVGELSETVEEVSFYEAVAHQALGVRRGDYVLIACETSPEEEQPTTQENLPPNTVSPSETPIPLGPDEGGQLAHLLENIRGVVDGSLLANLGATLASHSNPRLQSLSRALNQLPNLPEGAPPMPFRTSTSNMDDYINYPPEWLGEVVDLGLDGLITVRLGALDKPRDIKVSIDRVHIIFNDDMDLGGSEGYDDEMSTDDMSESSDEEPEILEETITYHGGERLDNGGDEDWLTDDDSMDLDEDESETKDQPMNNPPNTGEPIPRTPPPIPENVPAPEAISLPSNSRTPPRFLVLDTEVPNHAFAHRPSTSVLSPSFSRRISREYKILASSLPEGIFVRTWESRLDLFRVLIVGPLNTPYELAPFLFDFYFPPTFPAEPPLGHFHSWTNGIGRVNPNLYEEGKICISLLGTWHAENRGEGWVSSKSSVLQLLVSLMGLVLVREPWYNEAGFNVYEGSKEASLSSQLYSEKAFILARGFVEHALRYKIPGFEDVIDWLYIASNDDNSESTFQSGPQLLKAVVTKAREVISRSESKEIITVNDTADGVGRVSQGALVLLRRNLRNLEAILEAKK